jgi:CPA2 family monovalent cation:H+ antiporter-2
VHGHLLTDIAIILTAAFPVLFIGRKLRMPEVIAFLLTGIVIGPHALGLIGDTDAVEAIAEVGVALILFFIGLHIPLEKLRSLGRTALVSGTLQMAFTVLGLVAVAVPLGLDVRRATFFGLMIALGSTAVVLPILATRDEIGAPFARRFLGVSLFQDFAVIPLMVLVPAFASGAAALPASNIATRMAVALLGITLLVVVARVIIPRLFARIAAMGSRQTFTAAAIAVILGTIAIANQIGISAALGAFAAGVVVADTDFIHEIGGILRPFRDVFAALFFASIGMLLQPRYLAENFVLLGSITLAVVTLKVIAAYPAFRASGALERTSIRAAFALAPIGEFSFLLAQEGKRFGILRPNDEQLFIGLAVLTLAATPLLVRAGNNVARRMHRARDEEPSHAPPKLSRHIIIVGYGLNGENVSRVLSSTGLRHVVMEEDPARATVARERGSIVMVADAADHEALEEAGIDSALAVVIAISDQEGTRRIVQACRRGNEGVHILVRTRYVSEVEHLRELGANEVIPEEFETSIEIVTRLMRVLAVPANLVAAQLRLLRDEGYRLLRDPALRVAEGRRLAAVVAAGTAQTYLVMPDTPAEGKTLAELEVGGDHVVVPAMLREGAPLSPVPADLPLQAGDTLFLVGAHEDLLRVTTRLEQSLV